MPKRARNGTGCVYRRTNKDGSFSWWMKFSIKGRQIFRNARTTDRPEAERQLSILLGEKGKGVPIAPHPLTLKEAVDHVEQRAKTEGRKANYVYALHLLPFFGKRTQMAAISTPQIREYIAKRQAAGAANATVNRELEALGSAFSLALEDGVLFARPHIPMLSENNARSGFFERKDFERVKGHLPEPLQHVVMFGYITGWRLREVLNLRWRNVDLDRGEIRLDPGTTKNGDGRLLPIEDTELRRVLEARKLAYQGLAKKGNQNVLAFGRKDDAYVFTRKGGRPIGSFYKRWWQAVRAAGIPDRIERRTRPDGTVTEARHPGRIFHDFRRTAARNLINAGVPAKVAMEFTGHRTRSVFDRYHIVDASELRDAARKQEAARNRA